MTVELAAAPAKQVPRRGFWRKRVLDPTLALLTQGVTPDRVAATFAVGTLCSLLPFLGATTALNFLAGLWFRLNQPILHTLNQVLGPLQLLMILVYVRIGEWIWQAPAEDRFSVTEMIAAFAELSFGQFLQRFGWAGIHAFTAWSLTGPALLAAVYFSVRPALRKLAISRSLRSTGKL
jgi:uncharacterized protein (DUF2062 family)